VKFYICALVGVLIDYEMHGATIKSNKNIQIIFLCFKLILKGKMMIIITTVILVVKIRVTCIFMNLGLGPLLRNAR